MGVNFLSKIRTGIEKVCDFFEKIFLVLKERFIEGYQWIGTNGLINMETSALLMIFFVLLFHPIWSAFLTFIIMGIKCYYDAKHGSDHEKHDLICASIGIIVGLLLGLQ